MEYARTNSSDYKKVVVRKQMGAKYRVFVFGKAALPNSK